MYDADIIEKLYHSDLAGAAIAERPEGLEIISTVMMSMSTACPPVLLFRSALHQIDPDFDGSPQQCRHLADLLNRVYGAAERSQGVHRMRAQPLHRRMVAYRPRSTGDPASAPDHRADKIFEAWD